MLTIDIKWFLANIEEIHSVITFKGKKQGQFMSLAKNKNIQNKLTETFYFGYSIRLKGQYFPEDSVKCVNIIFFWINLLQLFIKWRTLK